MITHALKPARAKRGEQPRNSIGGPAFLPQDTAWPECSCGEQMVLFLRFDVTQELGLPFAPGSHFTMFMCPVHNDAPDDFDDERLPRDFWKNRAGLTEDEQFYELFLHRPAAGADQAAKVPAKAYLVHKSLNFARQEEEVEAIEEDEPAEIREHPEYPGVSLSPAGAQGLSGLKVGGQPCWAEPPVLHRCACGGAMHFLCQIPDEYEFAKLPSAPEQDNCYSDEYYNVFLGNYAYVFACEAQCDPRAVHVVVQN